MKILQLRTFAPWIVFLITAHTAAGQPPIDPVPRPVKSQLVHTWDFQKDAEGWVAENQCSLSVRDGVLQIQSRGDDPYFHQRVDFPGGQMVVELRLKSRGSGRGSVFWTSDQRPQRGEDKRADFDMPNDDQWLVTRARFTAPGRLTDLRIDPGTAPGLIEIDSIRLIREELHPLSISQVTQNRHAVDFEVTNHQDQTVEFIANSQPYQLPGSQSLTISLDRKTTEPLERLTLSLQCADWPPLERTAWSVHPDADTRWLVKPLGSRTLSIAPDGSLALVRENELALATLGPLVTVEGQQIKLTLVDDGPTVRFRGTGTLVSLHATGDEIVVEIDSNQACEGPVVRVPGELEQGLFAGLEYLGKAEHSSSRLDIETDEHIRFAPDPLKVTLPLMAFVTDRASVALTWDDMALQPVYATPNFFDGTTDHRMTLQGKLIRATIRVAHDPLEESIAWSVTRQKLPPLPVAPRTTLQQNAICLAALNGPLHTEQGWGHCVQENWQRQPFSDMASTLWRLGGEVPKFDRYVPGGAHVPNGTIYFVTDQAQQWLDMQRQQADQLIRRQQPDGSYRYAGKYARGHFEDTASGVCARPAAQLLEFAYVTGDRKALEAGLRTLDYMRRFRTPRGAQVWECALHTPDQLASAYLVWAYSRGFELTGNTDYLHEARKWALSGLPFTYLWGRYPIMAYTTPPVYGATDWVAPNWMGLPVQWVGGVYAYALTCLAPHEKSVDWNHVARGILISAQQQQYPDGPHIGLLPDSFNLSHQRRQPADINPCALVSLQLALDGEVDFLSVARDGDTVVAAPFPVTLHDGAAHIQGRRGVAYQILVNGRRIVDVTSQGDDVVALE